MKTYIDGNFEEKNTHVEERKIDNETIKRHGK
jgi:hypothetical protein